MKLFKSEVAALFILLTSVALSESRLLGRFFSQCDINCRLQALENDVMNLKLRVYGQQPNGYQNTNSGPYVPSNPNIPNNPYNQNQVNNNDPQYNPISTTTIKPGSSTPKTLRRAGPQYNQDYQGQGGQQFLNHDQSYNHQQDDYYQG